MKATSKNGHEWTGERENEWWMYDDGKGNIYESRETPVYRIQMNNACLITTADGRQAIAPRGMQ